MKVPLSSWSSGNLFPSEVYKIHRTSVLDMYWLNNFRRCKCIKQINHDTGNKIFLYFFYKLTFRIADQFKIWLWWSTLWRKLEKHLTILCWCLNKTWRCPLSWTSTENFYLKKFNKVHTFSFSRYVTLGCQECWKEIQSGAPR